MDRTANADTLSTLSPQIQVTQLLTLMNHLIDYCFEEEEPCERPGRKGKRGPQPPQRCHCQRCDLRWVEELLYTIRGGDYQAPRSRLRPRTTSDRLLRRSNRVAQRHFLPQPFPALGVMMFHHTEQEE